ncbi:MAG TPA: hypothetical protein VGR71_13765, partial [Nitrospira sp.]|nr:hypothetical protein [Nitrospira sp.]
MLRHNVRISATSAASPAGVDPKLDFAKRTGRLDHLIPAVGRTPLAKLQPQQLQRLYAALLESGKSPKTIGNIHRVMHRALVQAQRWRLISINVADLVDPPRYGRPEMKALTPEQARQVLKAAQGDELEALWTVALTSGLREGELLALKWTHVDLER